MGGKHRLGSWECKRGHPADKNRECRVKDCPYRKKLKGE